MAVLLAFKVTVPAPPTVPLLRLTLVSSTLARPLKLTLGPLMTRLPSPVAVTLVSVRAIVPPKVTFEPAVLVYNPVSVPPRAKLAVELPVTLTVPLLLNAVSICVELLPTPKLTTPLRLLVKLAVAAPVKALPLTFSFQVAPLRLMIVAALLLKPSAPEWVTVPLLVHVLPFIEPPVTVVAPLVLSVPAPVSAVPPQSKPFVTMLSVAFNVPLVKVSRLAKVTAVPVVFRFKVGGAPPLITTKPVPAIPKPWVILTVPPPTRSVPAPVMSLPLFKFCVPLRNVSFAPLPTANCPECVPEKSNRTSVFAPEIVTLPLLLNVPLIAFEVPDEKLVVPALLKVPDAPLLKKLAATL